MIPIETATGAWPTANALRYRKLVGCQRGLWPGHGTASHSRDSERIGESGRCP